VKLRRRLVAVWLVLATLLAVVAAIEVAGLGDFGAARVGARDPRLLLPVPVEQLGAVEIAAGGRLHRFEREPAGAWFYHGAHGGSAGAHEHAADPALAGRIAQALDALGRARIERELARDAGAAAYGLAAPAVVVLAYRRGESRPLAQYAVGDVAPDTVSRYVDVVGGPGLVTIPGYQVDNLLALVEAATSASNAAGPGPAPAPVLAPAPR